MVTGYYLAKRTFKWPVLHTTDLSKCKQTRLTFKVMTYNSSQFNLLKLFFEAANANDLTIFFYFKTTFRI